MKTAMFILALAVSGHSIASDMYVCKMGEKRVVRYSPCNSNEITTSSVSSESPAVAAARERQGLETQQRLRALSSENSREAMRQEKIENDRQQAYRQEQQRQLETEQRQQIIQQNEQLRQQQLAATAAAESAAARAAKSAEAAAANSSQKRRPIDCRQRMNGNISCF